MQLMVILSMNRFNNLEVSYLSTEDSWSGVTAFGTDYALAKTRWANEIVWASCSDGQKS